MAEIADDLRGLQPNYRRIRQLAYEFGDELGNISDTPQFNTSNALQTTLRDLTEAV
jgi:hypothetical protein